MCDENGAGPAIRPEPGSAEWLMWHETLKEIGRLLGPVSDAELRERWDAFCTRAAKSAPPHNLHTITELDQIGQERPRADIAILDHGCGPGSTLIWLAALGHTNVHGVDVGGKLATQNWLARLCWARPRTWSTMAKSSRSTISNSNSSSVSKFSSACLRPNWSPTNPRRGGCSSVEDWNCIRCRIG